MAAPKTAMGSGHVAVITGAGSGLGRALSVAIGYRGGRVYVTDIDRAAAEATAQLVVEAGGEAAVEVVDTTDPGALDALAEATWARWGRCDLLVNNAGVASSGQIGESSLDDWRWCLGVNLYGVLHGCRSFAPRMQRDGRGTIVNIASIAAFARAPMMGAYNVSKFGVVALSETLRAECLNHGVGVTAVCPAFFQSNIGNSARAPDERTKMDIKKLVSRSRVTSDDMAGAILAATAAGRPYVIPTNDARVLWYLRRLAPNHASSLMRHLTKLARRMLKAQK